MSRAGLLALWLAACGGVRQIPLDPTLPDGEPVEAAEPREVLEAATADTDPTRRGPALAWLVRGVSEEALPRWVVQGTHDPDPWVQRQVVEALLKRGARDEVLAFALRGAGDAYVRAWAAHALLDGGASPGALAPLRTAWVDRPAERAAPLALLALRLGEEAARPAVERALSQGDVRDDVDLLAALGRDPWPGAGEALVAASAWLDEGDTLRLDLARALVGEPGGHALWRTNLRGPDPYAQREALDLVLALPADAASPWLRQLRGARDRGTRVAAALASSVTPASASRALASPDAYVRAAGARALARLPVADAASLVARALSDDDAEVKIAAVDTAVALRLRALLPALEGLVGDDREEVRLAAQGGRLALGGDPSAL